ncbi:hypothetical protein FRB99_001439 [Tulasnella sp. 403]|nr:hypothetical protein FRB99_001439 [Tulasnella sp. 403]
MAYQTQEQLKHDRINLHRIVKSMEAVVLTGSFPPRGPDRKDAFIKATSTLTTLKYAREILEKLKAANTSCSYDDLNRSLDRMERIAQEAKDNLEIVPSRPRSLLSSMKIPKKAPPIVQIEAPPPLPEAELLPGEDVSVLSPVVHSPTNNSQTLDQPSTSSVNPLRPNPLELLKESDVPPNAADKPASSKGPAFLTTSLETQEELSAQLAQMGHQLKLNALHLANSLAKEKGVIEDAAEKLDRNLGTMTKERVRLRDHSGKSGNTTWLVVGAILCVIIAWVMMFVVIRLT